VVNSPPTSLEQYTLGYATPADPLLQHKLEAIDSGLRARFDISTQTAIGLLDLKRLQLAMLHPDALYYAASVPKIAILLAYFHRFPEAASQLDPAVRHELGLMIKVSSNEIAAKISRQLGLQEIQNVLDRYHFYDRHHGGGLWLGKHYGIAGERIGDPLRDHSHAATVRQLLRFYLLLVQGELVSPTASRRMLEIFDSPEIPHVTDKFVQGLAGRELQILRKSGDWEDWHHDTAIIIGPSRHYILVALTAHPRGDEYLAALAHAVDDLLG
jgi:beta-lactamase class A